MAATSIGQFPAWNPEIANSPQVSVAGTPPSGTVVLVSSGIDSTICADMYPEAKLLFVDFGQAEVRLERAAVRRLFRGRDLHEVMLRAPMAKGADGTFVPARNLLFACLAVQLGNEVVIGAMADDRSVDKTPEALRAMERILSDQAGFPVRVTAPLLGKLKYEAVADYLEGAKSRDEASARLRSTWSCYGPGPRRCLRCKACLRWSVALIVNGVDVLLPSDAVIRGYLARLHLYEHGRRWSILAAIRRRRPVAIVDLDGTITKAPNGRDYADAEIDKDAFEALRSLAANHWVVIYTARPERDRSTTTDWLARHGIVYHALVMDKMPCDKLYDDKAATDFSNVVRS